MKKILERLVDSFENSFVSVINGDFVADSEASLSVSIKETDNEKSIQCKILQYFSRSSFKSEPFDTEEENENFHNRILEGINSFLGTNFDEDDMEIIYRNIGNGVNEKLTKAFVNSNYKISIFNE